VLLQYFRLNPFPQPFFPCYQPNHQISSRYSYCRHNLSILLYFICPSSTLIIHLQVDCKIGYGFSTKVLVLDLKKKISKPNFLVTGPAYPTNINWKWQPPCEKYQFKSSKLTLILSTYSEIIIFNCSLLNAVEN